MKRRKRDGRGKERMVQAGKGKGWMEGDGKNVKKGNERVGMG